MKISLKKTNSWNFLQFKIIENFSSRYWFTCALYCISIARHVPCQLLKKRRVFSIFSRLVKGINGARFHCSIVFRNARNNWKRIRDISLIFRNLCWRVQSWRSRDLSRLLMLGALIKFEGISNWELRDSFLTRF